MKNANKHSKKSNVLEFTDVREFKTNIKSLDRLLGFNEDLGHGTGIKPGDIIVLRGGPGSGKTTLGLQIMSRYLESYDYQYAGNKLAAVFLSLEIEPEKVIDKVTRDFHFFGKRRNQLVQFPATYMKFILRKLTRQFNKVDIGLVTEGLVKAGLDLAIGAAGEIVVPVGKLLFDWGKSFLVVTNQDLIAKSEPDDKSTKDSTASSDSEDETDIEGILFIDSLNALLTIVNLNTQLDRWKARLALNSAFALIRKTFKRFVILVSSEFHHETSWIPTGMSESFLSDVEILLSNEPITVPVGYETSRQGSVGYNIFKIVEKVEGEEGTKLESRSFIRVLKSRKGANQSRRCAYDIVPGIGIQFYETYPGDGHILLFSENPKQEQVWDTFFKEDLPQLFPALRYEDFDRSSLQRTFLNQRRSRYVPSKTDMYLSSFDNYWINWYGELCWRRAVAEEVAERIPITDENKIHVAMLTSAIHKSLMRKPEELEDCLSKILQKIENLKEFLSCFTQEEQDRIQNQIQNDVLTAFAVLSRKKDCVKCFLCRFYWWLINTIAKDDKKEALQCAFRHISEECGQTDKNESIKAGRRLADPRLTPEIEEILREMKESIEKSDCCENSPIRQVYEILSSSQEKIPLSDLERSTYQKQNDFTNILNNKTNRICDILNSGKPVHELSNVISKMRNLIKSKKVRQKLEKDILNCYEKVKGEMPATRIREILLKYLQNEAGCECMIGFRDYLKKISIKRTEAIQLELNELQQEKKEQKRKSLTNKIKNLQKIYESLLDKSYEILNEFYTILPNMLVKSQDDVVDDSTKIGDIWRKNTNCEKKHNLALYNLIFIYYRIIKKRNMYHFLSSIPNEKIRLFGERRSKIITELEDFSVENKRPIHRPGLLFSLRDARSFVAIPYNANISFMVYRHDLLKNFIYKYLWEGKQPKDAFSEYVDNVLELYKEQLEIIDKKMPRESQDSTIKQNIDKLIRDNIKQYVDRESFSFGPLQTWEELIALLQLMNKKTPTIWQDDKPRWHFVIETQTLDSLLCTILELLWNCGGNLTIRPDYSIENEEHTKESLFRALYLLGTMQQKGIIPDDSTLDITHFANKYTESSKDSHNSVDWVFARHWYSTLIELLSTKKEKLLYRDGSAVKEVSDTEFSWQKPQAKLGIMPIPISLSYYLEHSEPDKPAHHISCWGDWHWIMTEGTENTELGIELFNNLVSSQKVCERAFQCAAVPTVEAFYTLHGNSRCLNLPERRYDTPEMLPDITFNNLRAMCFPHARSRSQIFDYEHCMLELQSLIRFVQSLVKFKDPDWEKLSGEIEKAFKRIKALRKQPILTF